MLHEPSYAVVIHGCNWIGDTRYGTFADAVEAATEFALTTDLTYNIVEFVGKTVVEPPQVQRVHVEDQNGGRWY
jgi:hypothetical protein